MTDIVKIENHVEQAIARLQSKFRTNDWLGVVTAYTVEIQNLETNLFNFIDGRSIEKAVGENLDNIGTIVVQERLNFDDEFYRVLIYVKIGINTSQANPEKVIDVFRLLTAANLVHLIDLENGAIELYSDGLSPTDDINFIFENMEKVVAAGIRINTIGFFDPNEAFSFAGNVPGLGFSDITGTTGGKFLNEFYRYKLPFAFAGVNDSFKGFGSLIDEELGGAFISLKEALGVRE